MKLLLLLAILFLACSPSAFAQTAPIPITGGRFLIEREARPLDRREYSRIETASFTAVSTFSYYDSVLDVCSGLSPLSHTFCPMGTLFRVPSLPTIRIGVRASPVEFSRGTFTLNGTTYQNVSYDGHFQMSQAELVATPMRLSRRKGFVRFTEPFTMTGRLQVCRGDNYLGCRREDIIFDGQIIGQGRMTALMRARFDQQIFSRPFLRGHSVEYQFEPWFSDKLTKGSSQQYTRAHESEK